MALFPLPLLAVLNHLLNPLKCPVDLFACDGEWRSDTDNVIMRLLAEESFLLQRLAVRPR